MIGLRVLGGLDMRDASGAPLDDLLRQPKRAALFLYLVLAEPAGLHRRDGLLALFWPDLDAQHARAALRKTLYVLRGALGPDVIVTRGDEEVGVDFRLVDCDALAFRAGGDLSGALESCRGDLLAGFFVSEVSPEWEQWLDARRLAFRTLTAQAAWRHSAALEEAGAMPEAVRWARWAVVRAPDDEGGLRRLLDLLGRTGDHAGALRAYEEFRGRLQSEFDAEPAPETQALVAEIRARTGPALSTVRDVPGEAPGVVPPAARVPAGRWWRPGLLAIPVVGAAIAAALLLRRAPPEVLQPDLVAVQPFTILSPSLEVWREGMVDLLSRNLDGAGPLSTVPPARVIRLSGEDRPDLEAASGLSQRTGAGLVIFGSLLGLAGDSVRVNATVFDADARRPLGDVETGGAANRMDLVTDSLTRGILRLIGRTRPIGSARMTGVGSRSVPALKAFLRGEQYRRRASWDSAQPLYEDAVELDSTFALAWLRLGEVYGMTRFAVPLASGTGPDNPWHLIYRAGTVNRGLNLHDSLMVVVGAGLAEFVTGRVEGDAKARANAIYQAALELARVFPADAEAWYSVALVQDFLGAALGTTDVQVYATYSRATGLDSGFAPAYRMAMRISGDAGDVEGTRRLAEQYLRIDPSPASRPIPLVVARLLDPAAGAPALDQMLDTVGTEFLWPVLMAIWLLPDSREAALRVAREIASRAPDPRHWFTQERIVRRNLAAVLSYRGHFRESLALAGDERATWFANLFPELSVWGAVPPARADSTFADWLEAHSDTPGLPSARWWWAVRRDTTALRRFWELARGEADLAYLAMGRRDTAEAMRRFAEGRERGWSGYFERLAEVRLLGASGRTGEALAILNGRYPNDWPIPSRVVWTLERARLSELAGQRVAATRDYRFVTEVWRDADPELQPYVVEAREGIRRLGGVTRDEAPIRARIGQPGAAVP